MIKFLMIVGTLFLSVLSVVYIFLLVFIVLDGKYFEFGPPLGRP